MVTSTSPQGDPGPPAVSAETPKKTFYISGDEEYMNSVRQFCKICAFY